MMAWNISEEQAQKKLRDSGLLEARRATALCWKSLDAPSLTLWIKEHSEYFGPERLTYIVRGKWKDFDQLWEPYMNITETRETKVYFYGPNLFFNGKKKKNIKHIWNQIGKLLRDTVLKHLIAASAWLVLFLLTTAVKSDYIWITVAFLWAITRLAILLPFINKTLTWHLLDVFFGLFVFFADSIMKVTKITPFLILTFDMNLNWSSCPASAWLYGSHCCNVIG